MQYNVTYRQKDKGWQYIISYKDVSGVWKQKSKQGFEKKKDAQKAADKRVESLKKEVEVAKNLEPEYEGITFGEFAEELLEHEKLHKTNNTILAKKAAIDRFKALHDIPLSELKHSDIQKCVDKMVSDGLKISTIKLHLILIKYILNQAVKPYRIIPVSPIEGIDLPALQYDEKSTGRRALEKEEIYQFLEMLKSRDLSLKYYYLCSFALGTGLRRGELLGLTWDNVDFQKREIHVVKQWKLLASNKEGFGTLKKRNSKRIVPVAQNTIDLLLEYKRLFNVIGLDNRVFPFTSRALASNLQNFSKRLGFKVNMHTLRHTYATNLIANGIDFKTAAAILGHDVEVTMRVYSHVTDDMMRIAANKINSIF